MAQNKKKLPEAEKQLNQEQEADRIAEHILSTNGGQHLYDKYLLIKDRPHCSVRMIQFFEEGIQFSFFPGDPGEVEEDFDINWSADQEPIESEVDHWATKIVKTKQIVKVENQIDDAQSSSRSKRALSIASSRKNTVKVRKITANRNDQDQKSRLGDSMRERSERKENQNINVNLSSQNTLANNQNTYNLIPLDVDPPREIPDQEKILRDRKERQLKMKELEIKEQREKEEREKQRLKNKQDAFAEIEKSEYTYDHNGKIIMVKRPNISKLPSAQSVSLEVQLHGNTSMSSQKTMSQVPMKTRTRLQSAKQPLQQEMKKAEQELQDNYDKIFNAQEESLKEYGLQKEPFSVSAGIVLTDKEGRKTKGPNIDRENKMTLQEYQKVAQQFDIDDKLSRIGSGKKLNSQEIMQSQLDEIQEDQGSFDMPGNRRSAERIMKNYGADEVYDRELSYTQYKINMKAKRKDLKSANVKNLNERVLAQHNKDVRITSAKQQQDVRIRRTPSKLGVKERIFNYESNIGGIDFSSNIYGSQISESRPQSGHPNIQNMQSKKSLKLINNKVGAASSLIDEFNKKLVEKGTSNMVLATEMPEASLYLSQKKERPQTSKPMSNSKKRINANDISDTNLLNKLSDLGRNSVITANNTETGGFLNNKSVQQKKAPRERIISAKLPRDKEKLPPPPVGKTMGHGLLLKGQNRK
ncbi:UNKNOWN [Stylonychia lemnae]|uniref:Uncharacterized protein n=1 Tax=Stylonychia lemnae TaxID=5949 RepID=A0A077ZPU8_STYLE|nr:UNKNOWN [Stylonychia lemnae]|eukprot:CDW71484.1 UNKNOWN [Stylonychia lemnae]